MKNKLLGCTALAIATLGIVPLANAETVTTQTFVQAQDIPHVNEVNFGAFDINKDGIYSMKEVGDRLFESFDRDNNDLIDNHEFTTKSVMTITPMEQETFKFIDYDDDGINEESNYTYQTFYKASGLMRFDKNKDGLSPADFIETPLLALDKNGDKLISLQEWDDAYRESRKKINDPRSYN